jgi:hypothetical protein
VSHMGQTVQRTLLVVLASTTDTVQTVAPLRRPAAMAERNLWLVDCISYSDGTGDGHELLQIYPPISGGQ